MNNQFSFDIDLDDDTVEVFYEVDEDEINILQVIDSNGEEITEEVPLTTLDFLEQRAYYNYKDLIDSNEDN